MCDGRWAHACSIDNKVVKEAKRSEPSHDCIIGGIGRTGMADRRCRREEQRERLYTPDDLGSFFVELHRVLLEGFLFALMGGEEEEMLANMSSCSESTSDNPTSHH